MKVDIYIPDKKAFRLTPNILVFGCVLLFFLILFILISLDVAISGDLIGYIWSGLIGVSLLLGITSYIRKKPLNGKLQGQIEFLADKMIINGYEVAYTEISNVSLKVDDYKGKVNLHYRSFNSQVSQGVDNYIAFNYSTYKRSKMYFQLRKSSDKKELYPMVKALIKLNKIPFLTGVDILELTDYHKIQELKKELNLSPAA
jgi:hypothetical protein